MLQISPENRLGHDLESLAVLKTHPFFAGIDFQEVSSKKFKGLRNLVDKIMPTAFENNDDLARYSVGQNVMAMKNNPIANENAVVLVGNLCKKNWFGKV
jgi:hypothetical protein